MNLPDNWLLISLDEIAAQEKGAIRRGPFGGSLKKDIFVSQGYKVYEQQNAIKNNFDIGNYYIDDKKYKEMIGFNVYPDDLIISCAGTIGRVAIVPHNAQNGIINQALMRLRLNLSVVFPLYLKLYLESPLAKKEIFDQSVGTALKNLAAVSEIKKSQIPIPPLNEQRRIVNKLERIGDRHLTARNELSHIPKLIARYKQAVLTAACSGKLTEDWREKNPSGISRETLYQRILQECEEQKNLNKIRGKGTNRSVPIQNNILPEVPSSWVWITADECAYDLTVGHVGSMKDSYVLEGIPFLRSFNVKPNTIDLDGIVYITEDFHNQLKKSSLSPGTVVVIRTGDPGVAAVIPDSLQIANCSDLVICRFIKLIFPIFAAYYINSSFSKLIVEKSQVGVAQQHFNVGAMSKLPMPIPPLEEQKEIVRRVEKMFEKIDKMEEEYQKAAKLCDRLEQATLAKAFRGELVPQDPDDEPASVLLEQVKREKEKGKKVRM